MVYSFKRFLAGDPAEAKRRKERHDALLKTVATTLASGDIATAQSLRQVLETSTDVPEEIFKSLVEGIGALAIRQQREKLQKNFNDNRFSAFSPQEQAVLKEALAQMDMEKAERNPIFRKEFGLTERYIA